jgi:predicted AAA+ superfamily ATPase
VNPDNEDSIHDFLQSQIADTPLSLNSELSNNGVKFNHRDDFEEIKSFIDNFIDGNNLNRYIVLPGLRGVGKTTILYQLYDYLTSEKDVEETDVFFLDMHDLRTVHNGDIKEMVDLYLENTHHATISSLEKKVFIFIAEAQLDKNWANYAKLCHDKSENIFMIVTGSSAITFEMNTDATRRIRKE